MTRNLLLSGGPGHDFDASARSIDRLLREHDFETIVVTEPEDAFAELRSAETGSTAPYDLFTVHALRWSMATDRYAHVRKAFGFTLTATNAATIDRFVRGGGGLLALHSAVICFDAEPTWRALCGAGWDWASSSHPPLADAAVTVTAAGRTHPLTEGFEDFTVFDEAYGFLDQLPGIDPLLTSTHGGRVHPILWARDVGAGRVVTDLLGHGPESLEHATHRAILARAANWAGPVQEERR